MYLYVLHRLALEMKRTIVTGERFTDKVLIMIQIESNMSSQLYPSFYLLHMSRQLSVMLTCRDISNDWLFENWILSKMLFQSNFNYKSEINSEIVLWFAAHFRYYYSKPDTHDCENETFLSSNIITVTS